MTDTMEALFLYAEKHTIPALLAVDEAYLSGERYAEIQENTLRSALNEHDTATLDAMLDEMALSRTVERRALFRAGFRLALELVRE